MIYSYQNLLVWKKAMDLVTDVYDCTRKYPPEEKFNLVDQMRRAAVSIPSNVAEGRDRGSDKDFIRFLLIARGSCAELQTQIIISYGQGYLNDCSKESLIKQCFEVNNLLSKFINKLKCDNNLSLYQI